MRFFFAVFLIIWAYNPRVQIAIWTIQMCLLRPLPDIKARSLFLLQRTTFRDFLNGSAFINCGSPLDEKTLA